MRKFKIFSITALALLLFTTVSFGALVDVVPDSAVAVFEAQNADNVIDFLYSDQLKSMTGGEFDLSKVREEVKSGLGFDALDPEFLKGLFANGMAVSITGFTEIGVPEVLIVLSPKNKMSFLKFIKAVEETTGIKEEVVTYKGVNITKLPIPDVPEKGPKEIAWSMVGGTITIGLTAAPVKEAIEVFKGEKGSIAKLEDYVSVKSKVEEKLGSLPFFFYMAMDKFTALFEALKLKLPKDQAGSLEQSISIFKTMKPMGFSGVTTPQGTKVYGLMGMPEMYVKAYENVTFPKFNSLNMFPKNTFFYIGGIMPFSWQEMKNLLPEGSRAAVETSFAQLKEQIGIDIEDLLLSWLDKEVAIGVFDPSGMIPKVGLLLGYSDKQKAQNAVNTILSMVGPALGGQPTEKEYEGVKYQAIENPMFPVGIGFVNDRLVAANGIENMIDTAKGNMVGFGKSSSVAEAVGTSGVTSIIYIDLQTIISIVERFAGMGGGLDEETKKVLDAIKKVKDIVYWAGYNKGDKYSFMWLKINNAQ